MPELIYKDFITLGVGDALQVILLGFIGGILSGFIGSGGAFFMTPGMMNLGVPGVIAVGSNITHKFGKAMVGARKHGEMGHVDKKLGVFMLITAVVGIRLAVWINSALFAMGDAHGEAKGAAANLYISLVFVGILSVVSLSMLRDILAASERVRPLAADRGGPPEAAALAPRVTFPVADVRVSLWVLIGRPGHRLPGRDDRRRRLHRGAGDDLRLRRAHGRWPPGPSSTWPCSWGPSARSTTSSRAWWTCA